MRPDRLLPKEVRRAYRCVGYSLGSMVGSIGVVVVARLWAGARRDGDERRQRFVERW